LDLDRVTLKRGDKLIVKIVRVPPPVEKDEREFIVDAPQVGPVAFSPDGRLVLTAANNSDADCNLQLWDVATGKEIRRFKGHRSDVTCFAFSGEGKLIVSGDRDLRVIVWDVEKEKALRSIRVASFVTGLAFSPDSKYVYHSDVDGDVEKLNTQTLELVTR